MHSKGVAHEAAQHLESVGITVAKRVLAEAPPRFRYGLSVVPVEHLAISFGVVVTSSPDVVDASLAPLKELGLDGLASTTSEASSTETATSWFTSDYEVQILGQGFRSRFTLAHELAHVVLSREYGQLERSLSLNQRERVCDIAAGNILCPEEALIEHFRTRTEMILTVSEIERLAGRMRISISLALNRLRQLLFQNALSVANVALLVNLARSRKRHEHLAPRIASACSPSRWFVPLNTRLATIGLGALQDAFYKTPVYAPGRTNEVLRLWDYELGRRADISCDVRYKCYRWVSSRPSTDTAENRIMLAVANCEGPS